MVKKLMGVGALLILTAGTASAVQTADILSCWGVQTGVVGGYQDRDNYIGGLGASIKAEFALNRSFSLSLGAGAGYNLVDGPLGGGGVDLKLRLLDRKRLGISLLGFCQGWYQIPPEASAFYVYGGGGALLSTLTLGYFKLTLGGGASFDFHGTSTDGPEEGALGPLGLAGIDFALSKASSLGLAFEYGPDRFFLGVYITFGARPWQDPVKKPTHKPAAKKPAAPAKK